MLINHMEGRRSPGTMVVGEAPIPGFLPDLQPSQVFLPLVEESRVFGAVACPANTYCGFCGPPCPAPCANLNSSRPAPASAQGGSFCYRASPWSRAPVCRPLALPPGPEGLVPQAWRPLLRDTLMPAGSEMLAAQGCLGVSGWLSRDPHVHNFRGTQRQFPEARLGGTPGRHSPFAAWVEVR